MSDEARARFLAELPDEALIDYWTVQVGGRSSTRQQVPSPLRWMLREHGRVRTSQGVKPLAQAVGPQLAEFGAFLPVADLPPEKARKLHLATSLEALPKGRWEELFSELAGSEDDAFVGSMYVLLTRRELDFPEGLTRCRVGDDWGPARTPRSPLPPTPPSTGPCGLRSNPRSSSAPPRTRSS